MTTVLASISPLDSEPLGSSPCIWIQSCHSVPRSGFYPSLLTRSLFPNGMSPCSINVCRLGEGFNTRKRKQRLPRLSSPIFKIQDSKIHPILQVRSPKSPRKTPDYISLINNLVNFHFFHWELPGPGDSDSKRGNPGESLAVTVNFSPFQATCHSHCCSNWVGHLVKESLPKDHLPSSSRSLCRKEV